MNLANFSKPKRLNDATAADGDHAPRNPDSRGQDRRRAILDAAEELYLKQGFDKVSLNAVVSSRPGSTMAFGGPMLLTGICFCACCGEAMTLRTGAGSIGREYRYYTCSTKAWQGTKGCLAANARRLRIGHSRP